MDCLGTSILDFDEDDEREECLMIMSRLASVRKVKKCIFILFIHLKICARDCSSKGLGHNISFIRIVTMLP